MALSFAGNLSLCLGLMLGSWAVHAMSRTLPEASAEQKFEQWIGEHGRTYADSEEKGNRFEIFVDNLRFIEDSNHAGNRTFKLGLNAFSDLTVEEFLAIHTGLSLPPVHRNHPWTMPFSFMHANVTDVPDSIDWVEKGAVNAIKDQGQCGCCWAFSTIATVESITQIKIGNLPELSEQQLVDCTSGNNGCNGGWMDTAFEYIIQNGGITSETNYSYRATDGTCNTVAASSIVATITGYEDVPTNNEGELLKAVAMQPVSIALDASGQEFQSYSSGIFNGNCGTLMTHAVAIVGYGSTEDGTKYWKIRNSWGETWGEAGYMRIQRDFGQPEGLCGLAMHPSYPIM
ncbi:hypothetical protein BT93_D0293 [Corymbia citriodora subsp. variegata]|nr:hypothetical protein BT93_D0293 [Corymbia citriodora subsp. variegata]